MQPYRAIIHSVSSVPQGSALSSALFIIYTSDIPDPEKGYTNIQYAEDITQIVAYRSRSIHFMVSKNYKKWKKINN